jgi:HD-GYP domain-containing protein (c-di-GMP phosphodiesterase class II)
VLDKRGKLSTVEFTQMKTHTTVGAEMPSGSPFAFLRWPSRAR